MLRCSQCIRIRQQSGIDDPPVTVEQLTQMTEYWNLNKVQLDNKRLVAVNDYLRKELEIVDWYVKYVEKGVDVREFMPKYIDLEEKH